MKAPLISVCIPTYNYAQYVCQAVESVLTQDFEDFELIVIDDCSEDNTMETIEKYIHGDRRVRFKVNPSNLGMVKNWNRCLTEARGKYIKYVFGDDVLSSKDALGRMATLLESDPSISLVSSARYLIDADSKIIRTISHFGEGVLEGREVIRRCLSKLKNLIGEPSVVMFRKEQSGRGFHLSYRQLVDLEMWFYLLEQGKFYYIDEPLSSFRRHPLQQTIKHVQDLINYYDGFRLIEDYLDKPYLGIGPLQKEYLKYDMAYESWKSYSKRGEVNKNTVKEFLGKEYGLYKFYSLYPLYKTCKPCLKLIRYLRGGASRGFP